MTQPIDRETAIALAKEAGAYYAGTTNPGSVYMLSESDIERLCNLAASRTKIKMPEPEPPIYGRELVLQLAADAGCPNGYLASFALHHPEWDWIERLCNLAVAHVRKDAEPVAIRAAIKKAFLLGQTYWQQSDSESFVQRRKADETYVKFEELVDSTMQEFTHPPEADKNVDKLRGCACRWDENDNRVATCVRHQGWLDVVEEWADRAKENQAAIDSLNVACAEQHTAYTSAHSRLNEADKLLQQAQEIIDLRRNTGVSPTYDKAAEVLIMSIRTYLEGK